jgi:hypothetical protein
MRGLHFSKLDENQTEPDRYLPINIVGKLLKMFHFCAYAFKICKKYRYDRKFVCVIKKSRI